jgi:hypothetical protein
MDDLSRAELVARYFVKTPDSPGVRAIVVCWLAGVVGALSGAWVAWRHGFTEPLIAGASLLVGLGGLFCLGVAGVRGRRCWQEYQRNWDRAQPKPTGAQMDQWRSAGIDYAIDTGMRRLDLHIADADRRHDILVFPGISPGYLAAAGEDDDIIRFPGYDILIVYLTSWKVSTFECTLDMATGALVSDRTQEFHLEHVDGIETRSDRIEMQLSSQSPDGVSREADMPGVDVFRVTTQQQLRLVVSGRPAIEMTIGLMVNEAWQSGMDRPAMDRLIARVREHLRRHMGGARAADPRVVDATAGPSGLGVPPQPGGPQWGTRFGGLPGEGTPLNG